MDTESLRSEAVCWSSLVILFPQPLSSGSPELNSSRGEQCAKLITLNPSPRALPSLLPAELRLLGRVCHPHLLHPPTPGGGVFMAPPCALFLSTHPSPAPAPAAHCGLYGTVATSKPHCGVRARVGEAPLRPGPGRPPWRSSAPTPKKKKKPVRAIVVEFWQGGAGESETPERAPLKSPGGLIPVVSSPGSTSWPHGAEWGLCCPHPALLALAAQKYWHWEVSLPILAVLLLAGW